MEESVGAEGLEFKWGKKRRVGGKNKDVQFYESFTYDGDEYCLYDCVLLCDPREPDSGEPFVGKIIKIWEHSNKRAKFSKQVKLLWFFKPSEISPYLEQIPDVLANELFLASGEGVGLANINPLVTNYSSVYYFDFFISPFYLLSMFCVFLLICITYSAEN